MPEWMNEVMCGFTLLFIVFSTVGEKRGANI